jgi:signal transduction histidine kinase
MFGLMFWRSSYLLFDTLDRSVLEQVELLSARPPEMLPFMISSRMNHRPAVVTQVGLFGPDGTPIVGDVSAVPDGLALTGTVQPVLAPGDTATHWHAAGRRLADGRILVVARAADEILEVRADLIRGAAVGILPAILLSLAGGALVGIATERRLRWINGAAERIISGQLDERLPGREGGDELDRLCMIVNRMLERFENVVAALQGVGDNIAHDLRTPLTSVRARLERTRRMADPGSEIGHAVEQSITGIDRALAIVDALLRVAEIRHSRRESAFAPFELGVLLSETAESFRPVADEKGIELRCPPVPGVTVTGDRELLVEAIVNLVDNAVKFTPQDGVVGIYLEGTPIKPVVRVSDTGPGIPPGERLAVFRRFFRTDASRTTPGSGLGLSLVAEIAALHRFGIVLGDEAPGCRFELLCWPGSASATVNGSKAGTGAIS